MVEDWDLLKSHLAGMTADSHRGWLDEVLDQVNAQRKTRQESVIAPARTDSRGSNLRVVLRVGLSQF